MEKASRLTKKKRKLLASSKPARGSTERSFEMRARILATIRKIPHGQVSTYGAIARAAGFPRGARLVARALQRSFDVPWQRVLGAGGEIKLRGDSAIEQRLRLQAEGVSFRGRKVNMSRHEFHFSRSNAQKKRASKRS